MTKKNYNFANPESKVFAKAMTKNAPVSWKYANEFAREIKGKKLSKAVKFVEDVIAQKAFLPLRKYNSETGHRKGDSKSFVKSGRYPKKLGKALLALFDSVKANADYKGLDSENLFIVHFFASKGFGRTSHQTQGRISAKTRQRKSAHLEIIVREAK